jgi:hypothetical protein
MIIFSKRRSREDLYDLKFSTKLDRSRLLFEKHKSITYLVSQVLKTKSFLSHVLFTPNISSHTSNGAYIHAGTIRR